MVFLGAIRIPGGKPHRRAQPLRTEAWSAKNGDKSATAGGFPDGLTALWVPRRLSARPGSKPGTADALPSRGAYVMATLRNLLLGLMELQKDRGQPQARTFPGWRRKLTQTQKIQLIIQTL
jgi:hypothetical protein